MAAASAVTHAGEMASIDVGSTVVTRDAVMLCHLLSVRVVAVVVLVVLG